MIFIFFCKIVQKHNVKTSRLLFQKRNRMLNKLPPAFLKSRREF